MATIINDGSAGNSWEVRRAAEVELARHYTNIICKMVDDGVRVPDTPWGDLRFQDMFLAELSRLRKYKADADKLAIIREVFGGKS